MKKVDEHGFFKDDAEIDKMYKPFQNRDIVDYGYDVYEKDKEKLSPMSTVLLNGDEFKAKMQKLLNTKPKKSILKNKNWTPEEYDNHFTNDELDRRLHIKYFDTNNIRKVTGLKYYHAYKVDEHYYLDYRHLWKNEVKSMAECRKKLILQLRRFEKQLDETMTNVYENSISKELNDKFIKDHGFESKAEKFLERVRKRKQKTNSKQNKRKNVDEIDTNRKNIHLESQDNGVENDKENDKNDKDDGYIISNPDEIPGKEVIFTKIEPCIFEFECESSNQSDNSNDTQTRETINQIDELDVPIDSFGLRFCDSNINRIDRLSTKSLSDIKREAIEAIDEELNKTDSDTEEEIDYDFTNPMDVINNQLKRRFCGNNNVDNIKKEPLS